jgi:uracil-DNA glycosylase
MGLTDHMADPGGKSSAPLLVAAQMREIEAQVRTCTLCRLSKTRTNAVPGEGDYGAEVMFIGEGPGYHEDRQGRPFVGNAGQFLNELLGLAGLSRRDVFIANVVKCRPPNNRDPNPDEMSACAPYLDRQIALVNPRIIVTLGRYSMARFFPGERISQIHGRARVIDGRMCVAMYHPAAGLHQASLADVIRSDFRKLPIYMEQARKMLALAPAPEPQPVTQAATAPPPSPEPDALSVQELATQYDATPADQPAPQPPNEPAPVAAAPRKRATKPKEKEEEYTQLSLFDL